MSDDAASASTPGDLASAAQASLMLDAPPLPPGTPLLPARMLNEFVYCPRLAYLEWVQGEWAESADTVEGQQAHRRVDKRSGKPPSPAGPASAPDGEADETPERIHAHSLELSSERLGLVAKLDLAEFEGRRAVPVDLKQAPWAQLDEAGHGLQGRTSRPFRQCAVRDLPGLLGRAVHLEPEARYLATGSAQRRPTPRPTHSDRPPL